MINYKFEDKPFRSQINLFKNKIKSFDPNLEYPFPFEKCVVSPNKSCYFENIDSGKEVCKNSKVAVVSLARNCEKNLQKSIDVITKLQSANFKFFIYENNSSDQTKDILISNQNNNQIFISLNNDQTIHLKDRSRERTNNLAKYRNLCLEWVKKECSDFDYVIVLDLDADAGFSIDGIYNSISWLNKIKNSAGMGSYSLFSRNSDTFKHYDTFAIRKTENNWEKSSEFSVDREEKLFVNYHPKIGSQPVPFYSCFGGLAVYKTKCFIEGNYDGSIGCEHVLFHKSLKDNGYDMYLNPSSIFFAVLIKDAI